jgi:hypothetical protein
LPVTGEAREENRMDAKPFLQLLVDDISGTSFQSWRS